MRKEIEIKTDDRTIRIDLESGTVKPRGAIEEIVTDVLDASGKALSELFNKALDPFSFLEDEDDED